MYDISNAGISTPTPIAIVANTTCNLEHERPSSLRICSFMAAVEENGIVRTIYSQGLDLHQQENIAQGLKFCQIVYMQTHTISNSGKQLPVDTQFSVLIDL